MASPEVEEVRAICRRLEAMSRQAVQSRDRRSEIQSVGLLAEDRLRRAVVSVPRGKSRWNLLLLRDSDLAALRDASRAATLPDLDDVAENAISKLTTDVAKALALAQKVTGIGRLFRRTKTRTAGEAASVYLREFDAWAETSLVADRLRALKADLSQSPSFELPDALAPEHGLSARFADLGKPSVYNALEPGSLPDRLRAISWALRSEPETREMAIKAGTALRRAETDLAVAEFPLERLRDATQERLRTQPLLDAGYGSVLDVLQGGANRLYQLPGIGETLALRMVGAARSIWQATFEEMPTRIDIQQRSTEATELLRALGNWGSIRRLLRSHDDLNEAEAFQEVLPLIASEVRVLGLFADRPGLAALQQAEEAVERLSTLVPAVAKEHDPERVWEAFLNHPADYFTMLSELGFLVEDERAALSDLPADLIQAVRSFELATDRLDVSLRGYQAFGARFALVQRRVILGDEMGLGKTVEALAVLAHLDQKGSKHSVVVCPAAVVTNWVREIRSKSSLNAFRAHGPGRAEEAVSWLRRGGVAVTTFESLRWFEAYQSNAGEVACVVVDEAHYIKNPYAQRSQRVQKLIDRADRALLLTGTPLENRVEEFRNLVRYVRPDLVVDATELRPRLFRQQVAPAYLRRNQEDVLTELPDLVEVEEWLPMSDDDLATYRDAVYRGNFPAMRRAGLLSGTSSAKISRLLEIVEEAEDNGRKVLVFSYFLDALDEVARLLPGKVFGPLTGSVPAVRRQEMVDEFSSASGGAVLVAQIVAGGTGLNIQAASVVVICEPQLKPTTEWQAIARARRMGQLQHVQVHRLLTEEGVDQRIWQILAAKRELFAEFARVSDTAASAPEAFDISEAALVKQVVADERQRLFPGLAESLPDNERAAGGQN
jgi:thymidine kinase